jgi:hypothetical protein
VALVKQWRPVTIVNLPPQCPIAQEAPWWWVCGDLYLTKGKRISLNVHIVVDTVGFSGQYLKPLSHLFWFFLSSTLTQFASSPRHLKQHQQSTMKAYWFDNQEVH